MAFPVESTPHLSPVFLAPHVVPLSQSAPSSCREYDWTPDCSHELGWWIVAIAVLSCWLVFPSLLFRKTADGELSWMTRRQIIAWYGLPFLSLLIWLFTR